MAQTMRALVVARYGGRLELTERPVPNPGPGEVLVRVRASGVCATERLAQGDVVGRILLTRP